MLADQAGPYAFVAMPNGEGTAIVEQRRLRVGQLTGSGLEVLSGVAPGDRLITAGMSKLQDGLPVRVSKVTQP